MRIRELKSSIDKLEHWGIMEKVLGMEIRQRQMIHSPLRRGDSHPSFGLFYDSKGQAKWKDFAMDNGDVYQLVMMVHGIDFSSAVRMIAGMVGLEAGTPSHKKVELKLMRKAIERVAAKCEWELREWDAHDFRYWHLQYGINRDLMEKYGFLPCRSFTMTTADGRVLVYNHTTDNPMYVMQIGVHGKLYRPFNPDPKYKYIGNTDRNDVFGLKQLETGGRYQHGVLSGGQKDGLAIVKYLRTGIATLNSESTIPDDTLMYRIFKCAENWWVLYDNDNAGRTYTKKLIDRYPMLRALSIAEVSTSNDFCDLVKNRESSAILKLYQRIHSKEPTPITIDR